MVRQLVRLNEHSFIMVDHHNQTSLPGLFAAGDVTSHLCEQILIAIGEGARAAQSAYDYTLVQRLGLAVSTIIVKRMPPQIDVLALTAWQLIAGSLPLLAASAVAERGSAIVWSSVFIALLVFLALIGTALANAVWYWLIRREDVGRLTLFFFLVPVLGLGIAALAFGETLGPREGTGVTLMLAGIGAVAWESWHGGMSAHAGP